MSKISAIVFYILVLTGFVKAQSADTVRINNKVLFITTPTNTNDSILFFNDGKGINIISKSTFEHQLFDTDKNKKRTIVVKGRLLIADYWISESDTVYSYIPPYEYFNQQLKSFYNYIENTVVYPSNALKKKVTAVVKIAVTVDKQGTLTNIFPISKNDWGFEGNVIKAIQDKRQFGFVYYNNRPIKYYMEVPFRFTIQTRN